MDSIDTSAVQRFAVEILPVWGARVAGVLVALFAAWLVAGWTRRMMLRGFERASFDVTLGRFFSNMARYAILVFAALGCLGVFGIETTSFAAVIAAGGLAVGLAFQGTRSNFAAGVMLLVFRPFKAGDVVRAAGEIGTIAEIELFTTEMTTADNRRLIIPNSQVFGSVIENITHHPTRRVEVEVGTAYDADIDRTREVLEAVVRATPAMIDEPAPQVFLAGLGASSVDWKLRVWCKTEDYWDVFQDLIRRTKLGLDEAGIGIPFPQTDVHLDKPVITALSSRS